MNKSQIKKLIMLFSAVLLSGCVWVDNVDDIERYVSEVQTRPSRPIKSLPVFEAYEAFVYEGTALRNPFVAVVQFVPDNDGDNIAEIVDLGNVSAPNNDRRKVYLERFSVKDLVMVGSISKGVKGMWALIVDPKGEIHRVTIDDYMGFDHGKVVIVNATKIKLIEIISNGRGGWITRPRSIELDQPKDP